MLRRLHTFMTRSRFLKARDGGAAVEFALIAPVLIIIYWGLTDLSLGMMASRKTAHLAATMGDLVAQSESLSEANVLDIFQIGSSILEPFPTGTKLKMRFSCVTRNKTNNVIAADWSRTSNWDGTALDLSGITVDQLPAGESLIVTEVKYDFKPPAGEFLPTTVTFKNKFYHHPRSGGVVAIK
ncbi:TadE/TadG family type IV pilus assembly protein [Asticcacaulis sp. AND118]|uniref:TadE/TadG family type IV pilus assembly protein n=1 Tax=Asticcacaulis sp. AND118 TaxID=2840468 RepID=UPI001CFFAF43|nr:TadE/TadG family type IV pilus assembly protein [Asticcacaulis sp. AND118]UDF03756.1 pilus assembly protein [Asticcacaulis sp. AND118]